MHDIKLLIKFLVIHIFCYSILLSENSFENKNLKFELTDGETLEEYFGKLKKFIDYYKKDDISLSINDKTSFVRKQSIKIKTDYFFEKKSDQFTESKSCSINDDASSAFLLSSVLCRVIASALMTTIGVEIK